MKKVALFILCIAGPGCVSFQEVCAGYGFEPGTDSFTNCVMTESRESRQRWGQAIKDAGKDWGKNSHHRNYNNQIKCTTRPDFVGGSVTTCN